MGRIVRTKTMKDGNKVKIIQQTNSVDTIYQKILKVSSTHVQVISGNMKKYMVKLSDKVKMTMNVQEGDTAIIKTFPNGWLVVDIKKQEPELDKYEQELKDLKNTKREFEERGWVNDSNYKRICDRINILSNEELLEKEKQKDLKEELKELEDLWGGY